MDEERPGGDILSTACFGVHCVLVHRVRVRVFVRSFRVMCAHMLCVLIRFVCSFSEYVKYACVRVHMQERGL